MGTHFKVIDTDKELRASCTYAADAAQLAGLLGEGTRVEWRGFGFRVRLWIEGAETFLAADEPDRAAEVMRERLNEQRAEWRRKRQQQAGVRK